MRGFQIYLSTLIGCAKVVLSNDWLAKRQRVALDLMTYLSLIEIIYGEFVECLFEMAMSAGVRESRGQQQWRQRLVGPIQQLAV